MPYCDCVLLLLSPTSTSSLPSPPPVPPRSSCLPSSLPQFDTLLGDLTVREMLLYTAELKRPTSEPLADKRDAVRQEIQRVCVCTRCDVC